MLIAVILANQVLTRASEYVILDHIKDIDDLDVGDLDDIESDVSPMFLDRVRNNGVNSEPQMLISILRWEWTMKAKLRGTEDLGYTWMVSFLRFILSMIPEHVE